MFTSEQHTILRPVTLSGVGLHSGQTVCLTVRPAHANHGIVFKRVDVSASESLLPARYDLVKETQLGTVLVNDHGHRVSTIEHLMAALWGCGVDNALIELDGPEVPIMDGSSEPFVALIEEAGVYAQAAPRYAIEVLKPVTAKLGEAMVTLEPHTSFSMDVSIDFDHQAIAQQYGLYDFSHMRFADLLSEARTFGFEHEVQYLRSIGLARGGSLENAIVIGKDGVLNPEGLRFEDEFVRHKALDCIGDLYLAGAPLLAHVTAHRPGHGVNNAVLRALIANDSAWRLTTLPDMPVMPAVAAMALGI